VIVGLLAMIVANAAAILGARSLLERVQVGKPAVDFLIFLLLRLLLISGVMLAAGAARMLGPIPLGLAGAVVGAALVARGVHRTLLPLPRPQWDRWIVAVFAIVGLRLLLQTWILAPYNGDALSYHLPKIAEWVRAGALTLDLGPDPRAAFPAGFELIETWWVVFLHHDVLIELAGVEFLVLAGAAAYAIARELEWDEKVASISALAFVLTPGLHQQATSCLNDGPVAALVAATAALIVARADPLLILIPVGLGTGIKPTYVFALPGLAAIAWWSRRDAAAGPRDRRPAAALGLAAVVAGATWYVRNWVAFGIPIHPMGSEGYKSVSGATMQRLGPSLQALRENLTSFLDVRVFDRIQAADPLGAGNFNWGVAAFAVGAPALVALLRTEPRLRRIALGLTLAALTVFSLVELDAWYARFVLYLPLLTSLALARLWTTHRFVAVLGSLALAMGFLSTLQPSTLPKADLARLVHQDWSRRAPHPPPRLPEGDQPVGCLGDELGGSYALYGPDFSRRVVVLRDDTVDGLMAHLERDRVRMFYGTGLTRAKRALLDDAVARGKVEPFEASGWKGYAVRDAR